MRAVPQEGMSRAMEVVVGTARFGAGHVQPPAPPPGLPIDVLVVTLAAMVLLARTCSRTKHLRVVLCPCRL
jgi:hypothetical protein